MAIYITRRCPHCNNIVFHGTQSHSHSFGSPFCVCERCHKTYVDKTKHEIALKGPEYYRNFMPYWVKLGIGLSLPVLVLSLIAKWNQLALLSVVIVCVFLFIYADIRDKHPNPRTMYQTDIKASEERLSNPEYARALKKHGYDVPERYLK